MPRFVRPRTSQGRGESASLSPLALVVGGSKRPAVASDVPELHRLRQVATALTRARKARLPSPWTEAVDFLCCPQSRARQCSTFLLARAPRSRKSTASGQGEGP